VLLYDPLPQNHNFIHTQSYVIPY